MSYTDMQEELQIDALIAWLADGVVKAPTFVIGADPTTFDMTSEVVIVESGVMAGKGASVGSPLAHAFLEAHVITASKWGGGIITVTRDTANTPMVVTGQFTTKVPGATQITPMAYNSEALARAAIDALTPDAGHIKVADFVIEAGVADFTANTSNLTTDITSITFTSVAEKVLPTPLS